MKGGYVLVNAAGVDLNVASATINGIYAKFINAVDTGKLIIVQNVVNDDDALSPTAVTVTVSSGVVGFTIGSASIAITDEDAVTIS